MTDTATDTILSVDQWTPPLSNAEQLEQIKQSYPAYYRAWRSMISNNSKDDIIPEWRGTIGLMRFIEDTSTLLNNPSVFPDVKVKLKRKLKDFPYSLSNVYWLVPRNCRKSHLALQATSLQETSQIITLDTLIAMSRKDQEDRFNTLMSAHFSGTILSATEQAEMDALGKLITGMEILPPPESKYEDV